MNDLPERLWLDDAAIDSGYAYTHDPCNSFITEYIRADTVPQWQPIENAKGDWKQTITFNGGIEYHSYFDGKLWYSLDHYGYYKPMNPKPTHCMPIPTPPKE